MQEGWQALDKLAGRQAGMRLGRLVGNKTKIAKKKDLQDSCLFCF